MTKQLKLLKSEKSDYGGGLSTTRDGRSRPRPLSTRHSMHLVLRSTQAIGEKSFKRHNKEIQKILAKFSAKYAVRIASFVNVGNHLHIEIKLFKRDSYRPFIRAITAAIMMAVTGVSRWNKQGSKVRFWDLRPFTRICTSFSEVKKLKNYFTVNFFESMGYTRQQARFLTEWERNAKLSSA